MGAADLLDRMPPEEARAALLECCAATRWVDAMMERRPFGSDRNLLAAAEEIWRAAEPADLLEAFAGHPRIGERPAGAAGDRAASWAGAEQSGVGRSDGATRDALAAGNRAYEERFGHVFLICATGLSGPEMLAELERRLHHSAATELRIAAAEQAKITRLRLQKLGTP